MAATRDTLLAAIDRWVASGLVDQALAERLREDTTSATARERVRWSQFFLASTAALVLLTAAGVFMAWAWPSLTVAARTWVLIGLGLGVKLLGMRLEARDRWVPASYLMQTAGLAILLAALAYSEEAWPDATAGGVLIGTLGLALPLVMAWFSLRRNPIMPAVHAAMGYGFLGLFLSRAMGLHADEIIWILDAVLLLSVALLLLRIKKGDDHQSEWALNAFVASLYAGLVLVVLTALGPLHMSDDAVLAMDLWWLVIVLLTLWAIHRAPPALQRSWYEAQLGWTILLGIVFAFATASVLDFPDALTAAVVGVFGAGWLWYGVPRRSRAVLLPACLALVSAAWYLGVEEAGALGAVLALAFTAGLLFWVSSRIGSQELGQ